VIHPEIQKTSVDSAERSFWLRAGGVRKSFLLIGKIFFSVALLGYLLMKVEWRNIVQAMGVLNPLAFLISWGFLVLAIILGARRWRLFIPYPVSARRIISFCFIGAFFNICLPGVVGGDIIKAYYLGRELKGKGESVSWGALVGNADESEFYTINSASLGSVFMDRFMGLAVLLLAVFVVYPWGYGYLKDTPAQWIVPAFLIAISLAFIMFFKFKVGKRFIPIQRFHNYLEVCATQKSVLFKSFLYSICIQFLAITSVYIIAWGLSLKVSLFSFFVFIPLINILLLIPVSISGIGLREGAFAYFFGTVGVPPENAIALSLLWFLSQLAASLLGLYVYVRLKKGAN